MEKVSVEVAEQESVENALYKDPTVSVKDRVADLISRMTLEEKAAQMEAKMKSRQEAKILAAAKKQQTQNPNSY